MISEEEEEEEEESNGGATAQQKLIFKTIFFPIPHRQLFPFYTSSHSHLHNSVIAFPLSGLFIIFFHSNPFPFTVSAPSPCTPTHDRRKRNDRRGQV
jgi:hypothetical protein